MKIFSGSSNPLLAKKIAKKLGVSLGKREIKRFANLEIRVRILERVSEEQVFVIQSLSNPVNDHLFELLLLTDALKRLKVKKVIAVIPYLGYARQDKAYQRGEAVSASVLARGLEAVGVEKVITVDAHSREALSYFKVPVVNLLPTTVFANEVKGGDWAVVSPDLGGIERARRLAQKLKAPLVVVKKKRDFKTGEIKNFGVELVEEGAFRSRVIWPPKKVLIVDDIITSGKTLAEAARVLKEKGAETVWGFVTHPDFIGETESILKTSPVDKIFVTDAIKVEKEKMLPGVEVLTVSDLIAKNLA